MPPDLLALAGKIMPPSHLRLFCHRQHRLNQTLRWFRFDGVLFRRSIAPQVVVASTIEPDCIEHCWLLHQLDADTALNRLSSRNSLIHANLIHSRLIYFRRIDHRLIHHCLLNRWRLIVRQQVFCLLHWRGTEHCRSVISGSASLAAASFAFAVGSYLADHFVSAVSRPPVPALELLARHSATSLPVAKHPAEFAHSFLESIAQG